MGYDNNSDTPQFNSGLNILNRIQALSMSYHSYFVNRDYEKAIDTLFSLQSEIMQVLNENNEEDKKMITEIKRLCREAQSKRTTNLGTFTGTRTSYCKQKIVDWYAYLKRVETDKKIGMPMEKSVDNTNEVY